MRDFSFWINVSKLVGKERKVVGSGFGRKWQIVVIIRWGRDRDLGWDGVMI